MHCVALPHVQPRYALTTYVYYCCIISTMHDRLYAIRTDAGIHATPRSSTPPRLQDPPGILCLLDYDHSLLACFAEPRRCRLTTSE
jgi:hypothetical protein